MGVEIVHAATKMRLLDNASSKDYRKLLQQAFPTLSMDRLVSRPSDTEKSEMRTYGMVKRLADMRKSFLDSHTKGLDQMLQQVWEGEAFARRREYLQLFDILQHSIQLVNVLEKDIELQNQAYGTTLKKFREVFTLNKRAVQIVSAGFHYYCQTEYNSFQILQADPKHLRDFAASFIRQPIFTDDI
jgi:hypothetical protein